MNWAKVKTFFQKKVNQWNVSKSSLSWKKTLIGASLTGAVAVIAGTSYSTITHIKTGGDYVEGYSGRVELDPFVNPEKSDQNNNQFGTFSLEGKKYDFDQPKVLTQAVEQAAHALSSYNKSLGNADFDVNYTNANTYDQNKITRALDLHFRAKRLAEVDNKDPLTATKTPKVPYNQNNAWFNFVHLNQLSIDRYGFRYAPSGTSVLNNQPQDISIVSFNDVGINHLKRLTLADNKFDGLQFNIYDKDIPASEFQMLANTDQSRYVIPDQYKNTVKNTIDVWLDKDLLALKLNYIYQTYVFNQNWAYTFNGINSVVGYPTTANGQNAEQKQRYQAIRHNYYALSDDEKKFAEDYLRIIVQAPNGNADAVDRATKADHFIKASSLISIYNAFKANSGSTSLFNGYLLAQITGGANGNWTQFFPKYNTTLNKDFKEKYDLKKPAEFRDLFALNANQQVIKTPKDTDSATIQSSDNKAGSDNKAKLSAFLANENVFRLAIDTNITNSFNNQQLYDRLTKYSVRYLKIRKQAFYRTSNGVFNNLPLLVSGVYSNVPAASSLEIAKIGFAPSLAGLINNPFINNLPNWGWYLIATIIFLILIGVLVAVLYRFPGIIAYIYYLAALSASLAAFFGLNLELTTDATVGIITGMVMSLFMMFYILNYFVQQVRNGNSLKQANFRSIKAGFIFSFDLFVVIFFSAIIFAFLANLELRGFGLMLSIQAFMGFFVYAVGSQFTNWLLVETFIYRPGWFISKKNQRFLKTLSGELQLDDSYAPKVLTRKYYQTQKGSFSDRNWIFLFNKKFLVYLIALVVFLIVGISLIFIPGIGFGSSFILKNGVVVEYVLNSNNLLKNHTLSQAQAALSAQKLSQLLGISFVRDFLPSNPNAYFLKTTQAFDVNKLVGLFSQWFQPNSYSIQKTTLFNGVALLKSAFSMISISLAIIGIYFAIRYNWLALVVLWVSTFILIAAAFALIAITRLSVDQGIIGAIIFIYSISMMFHVWWFNLWKIHFSKNKSYDVKQFFVLVNEIIFNQSWMNLALLFGSLGVLMVLGAGFNFLQLSHFFIYDLLAIILVPFTLFPITVAMWIGLMYLRQKIFYIKVPNTERDLFLRFHIRNRDAVDEQLILNINTYSHHHLQ